MREQTPVKEREKRAPETVKKIMTILAEDGFLVADLDPIIARLRDAVGQMLITRP